MATIMDNFVTCQKLVYIHGTGLTLEKAFDRKHSNLEFAYRFYKKRKSAKCTGQYR